MNRRSHSSGSLARSSRVKPIRQALCLIAGGTAALAASAAGPARGPTGGVPAATAMASAGEQVVYRSDFSDLASLARWSKPQVDKSAGRPFLGKFYNDTESLALTALPRHAFVRVTAQLLIMDSWDGSKEGDGPDSVSLRLDDGRTLLNSTFSIYGPRSPQELQRPASYPDNHPGVTHPGLTGAAAVDVNGIPKSRESWGGNAIWNISFTFPHTAAKLRLDFAASLRDSDATVANESWGLGNVDVAVLPESPVRLDAPALAKLAEALGSADPMEANQALVTLIAAGDRAVDAIGGSLRSRDPAWSRRMEATISLLENDDYRLRVEAEKALLDQGQDALPICRQALAAHPPPEAEARLATIIATLTKQGAGALVQRRQRVLQIIGSDRARALLANMGGAGTGATRAARAD
jgi:hypothetical protein